MLVLSRSKNLLKTSRSRERSLKVTVKRSICQALLEKAFGVAAKSSATPVLQNVKFVADDAGLVVTGTDGELMVIARSSQADVFEPGSVLFSPKVLDVVRRAPEDNILIDATPSLLTFTVGEFSAQIKLDRDAYPATDVSHAQLLSVPKEALLNALAACRPAIASDTVRPMFAFVQVAQGYMTATDGSRVHRVSFPYDLTMLWPSRAVPEILRRGRSMSGTVVEVGETPRTYTFRFDEDLLVVMKHAQEYPDVDRRMIESVSTNELEFSVDRKVLLEAVRRAVLTADVDTHYLSMALGSDRLVVSTFDKAGNNSSESIKVSWPHSHKTVGLNYEYLSDVLSSMSSPQVTMCLRESGKPGTSPFAFREEGFLGVLVQLRSDLGEAAKNSAASRPAPKESAIGRITKAKVPAAVAPKDSDSDSSDEFDFFAE